MNKHGMDGIRVVGWIVFSGYLFMLLYMLFFAEMWGRTEITGVYSYNLQPFQEIMRFIRYREQLGFWVVFFNLGGNVIGFMPFGFCVPLLDRYHRRWYVICAETMAVSVCIELIQLVTRVGSCDVDDVLLNTIGGVIGYVIFMRIMMMRRKYRAHRIHKT